jgi:hypothetical protein
MRKKIRSINVSYETTMGNEFNIQLFKEGSDKAMYIDLNRSYALSLAQQLLKGLADTKGNYNYFVKTGRRKIDDKHKIHDGSQ